VRSLKHYGIKGMIFGDIHLEEYRQWVEKVCKELGIEPIEPLWKRNTKELMQDFTETGIGFWI